MRSGSTLVGRVALVTGACAGITALLAAVGSVLVADRLLLAEEDTRLEGTAALVARELPLDGDDDAIAKATAEEVGELAPESIRIAVRRDGKLLGGDPQLPMPSACSGSPLRVCTTRAGRLEIAASALRPPHSTFSIALACLAAALIAAIAAAVVARRSARWALAPLTRLRDSVDRIPANDPAPIPGDDACTEVANLRVALNGLVARLGDALGAARRFSADAAHELKTPLTTISVELDLLAEEPLDGTTREAVTKLRRRATALTALVERLLALARVTDRARLASEPIAIEDIVNDVVANLGIEARQRVCIRAEAQGMVLGDEVLIAALLENAIDNALKFSGDAPVDVHVAESDRVLVEITDRGPGLALAERSRAFEPFFRTPQARAATSGNGIGLALVAQIARAHDGAAVFVDAPAGAGACLRVTLPKWSARLAPV